MNSEQGDKLQMNIRRNASVHALREIHAIAEEERKTETLVGRVLHVFLLYGWVVLLLLAGIVAHFMGVI
jgi:hypothetical protein